jgi:F0F1-type ATP synthase membrane subunit b/b'
MSLEQLAMWSQIVGAVVFLIVAVLIWRKYIAPGVKAYQAAKNAELAEAEARRDRIRADAAAAHAEIDAADADAGMIRERAASAAEHERVKTLEEAAAEAARIVRNAEGELERARLAARDRLRIEFIEKALAKARAEAPQRVGDGIDKKLVEETIADLTRGKA